MKISNTNTTLSAALLRVGVIVLAILLVPFVLTLMTDEVDWSTLDFVMAGFLLFAAGSAYVFLARNMTNKFSRLIIGLVIFGVLLLVWAELAVGIFGTPWAGN